MSGTTAEATITPTAALMVAAKNKNVDTAKKEIDASLQAGARLEEKDENGHTALIRAINARNSDIAKYLLEKGADVDAQDNEQKSATYLAIKLGQNDVAHCLVRAGANTKSAAERLIADEGKFCTTILKNVLDQRLGIQGANALCLMKCSDEKITELNQQETVTPQLNVLRKAGNSLPVEQLIVGLVCQYSSKAIESVAQGKRI